MADDGAMDLEAQLQELTQRVARLEALVERRFAELDAAPTGDERSSAPPPVAPPAIPPSSIAPPAIPPPAPGAAPVAGWPPPPGPPPPGPPSGPPPPGLPPGPPQGPPSGPARFGPAPAGQPPRRPAGPSFDVGLEALLRWAGVALVTLAAVFLVSAAISRGWIGPELQLLGATLGGVALLAGAWNLASRRPPWSLAMGAGGAVVLATCAVATHQWLDLVGPGVAVALTALVTVASTVTARATRQQGTALTAGVAALVAPAGPLDDLGDVPFVGWVVLLVVASAALGLAEGWRWTRLIVGWLGALMLLGLMADNPPDGSLLPAALAAIATVATVLWLGPLVGQQRAGPQTGGGIAFDVRTVAAVPAWFWLALGSALDASADQFGWSGILVGLAFAATAGVVLPVVPREIALSTLLGGLGVVAVGVAIYVDGPVLTVALMVHGLTSYLLGQRLQDRPLRVGGGLMAHLALLVAVVQMVGAIDDGYPSVGHAGGTLFAVVVFVGAAALAYGRSDAELPFVYLFVVAWGGVMLWFTSVFADLPQGLTFVSAVWAAMACAALVVGLQRRDDVIRVTGLVTLGVTLLKLFTIDLAEIDVFWRVGLFFVVGVGLIALGLLVPSLVRSSADTDTNSDTNTDAAAGQAGRRPGQGAAGT